MNPRMLFWLCFFPLVTLLTACGGGGGGSDDGGGGVVDDGSDVVVLDGSDVVADDGGGIVDTKAPYVISTNPVLNSTAVGTNRAITSTFNEAIDPSTITSNSFLIDNGNGDIVAGDVSYDSASRTATFRNEDFFPETTYVATITNDVEDLVGNTLSEDYTWQFTTGALSDTTPPVALSRFPTPNASTVALNTGIAITFDEPIDPSTIDAQTLTLNGPTSVAGDITFIGSSVLFTPEVNLVADSNYTVSVADTIKDLAGNSLPEPIFWNFTTGIQPDLQSPQVISVSPLEGAGNVPIDSSLVVSFDEALKPFEYGVIDGKPVTVTYNENYSTVSMKPTAGLRLGVSYTAGIYVQDQAGNFMDELFVWKFTTTAP